MASDKCGIIAIINYNQNNIIDLVVNGLYKLQHRGRESAGFSYITNSLSTFKNLGLVSEVFQDISIQSHIAIGHVRYSTCKKTTLENKLLETQPIQSNCRFGDFAIAHNGNIPNLDNYKSIFDINYDTQSDTIILTKIIQKLSYQCETLEEVLKTILHTIQGVYCLVIIINNQIYAIKDSYGVKPLSLAILNDTYILASETVAFPPNATIIREIDAGEIITITNKVETIYQYQQPKSVFCSFEYIYFMRNDSIHYDQTVYQLRYKCGYHMGINETNLDENALVIGIPHTATPSAHGFASATQLEYKDYIQKKDNGRTFILPTNEERINACNSKFNYDNNLKDKNIYLIDDSIVRGNTMASIIRKLREIGVKKIHLRITSPPVISECYYGIDIPTKNELIAHRQYQDIANIITELDADSLIYLDIDVMKKIFGNNVCTSCFTNDYDKNLLKW